jgi:hypothetical protein
MWSNFGKVEVFSVENDMYIFRFTDEKTRDAVFEVIHRTFYCFVVSQMVKKQLLGCLQTKEGKLLVGYLGVNSFDFNKVKCRRLLNSLGENYW